MKTLLWVTTDSAKQVAKVGISMIRPGPLALYRCRLYVKEEGRWKAFPAFDALELEVRTDTAVGVLREAGF